MNGSTYRVTARNHIVFDGVDEFCVINTAMAKKQAAATLEDRASAEKFARDAVRALNAHDALLAALKDLTDPMPPKDAPCHRGIVPQERCANCQRIAAAHAAIKLAEA